MSRAAFALAMALGTAGAFVVLRERGISQTEQCLAVLDKATTAAYQCDVNLSICTGDTAREARTRALAKKHGLVIR